MDEKTALNKTMQLCSRREYCSQDILDKLQRWEVPEEKQLQIITSLIENKFIDHTRFTEAFINDKIKFNHWGKIKVRYYLKHKSIEKQTIDTCLQKFDETIYQKIATEEIEKKWRKTKAKSNYEHKNKVAKSVINKGFEPNLVFDIIDSLNLPPAFE